MQFRLRWLPAKKGYRLDAVIRGVKMVREFVGSEEACQIIATEINTDTNDRFQKKRTDVTPWRKDP